MDLQHGCQGAVCDNILIDGSVLGALHLEAMGPPRCKLLKLVWVRKVLACIAILLVMVLDFLIFIVKHPSYRRTVSNLELVQKNKSL